MYTHMHLYMHVYIYIYMHMHMRMHMHIHIHIHIRIRIRIHIHIHMGASCLSRVATEVGHKIHNLNPNISPSPQSPQDSLMFPQSMGPWPCFAFGMVHDPSGPGPQLTGIFCPAHWESYAPPGPELF